MRVKITQPGWEQFNDVLYGVSFKDGVSEGHLSRAQAMQLGAMMTVVEIDETGDHLGPVSPSLEIIKTLNVSAEVVEPMKTDAERAAEEAANAPPEGEDAPAEGPKVYTEAELVEIADAQGIAGLRAIAPAGVKNTAIKGMIRDILAAQGGN